MFSLTMLDFHGVEAECQRGSSLCWLVLKFKSRDFYGEEKSQEIVLHPRNADRPDVEIGLRRLAQAINESQQPQGLSETVRYEEKYPIPFTDGSVPEEVQVIDPPKSWEDLEQNPEKGKSW